MTATLMRYVTLLAVAVACAVASVAWAGESCDKAVEPVTRSCAR